ncbi:MAG: MFS transporter [Micrococcaceae bacterium]
MSTSILNEDTTLDKDSLSLNPEREPKGFAFKYATAAYGVLLAILMPVLGGLAVRLQHINDGDIKKATAQLALVSGIGGLVALLTQPLAGRISDRTTSKFGMRKVWIVIGSVLGGLAVIALGFAPNFATIFIVWCLAQFFSNIAQATITATLPDQVPESRRGVVSGFYGACTPLAILTGAVLLGMMPSDTMKFAVPGVIGIVCSLWFALTLKDRVLKPGVKEPFSAKEFFSSFTFNPKEHPDFGWAWLSKFLVMFGYASVGTYLVLLLASKFGMNTEEQTKFNMYATMASVASMVVCSLFFGKMSDRIGKRKAFVLSGGVIAGVGILLIALSPLFGHSTGLAVIIIGELILGVGIGTFGAVDMALCTEVLPHKDDTAKDLGVLNIANALPQSIAPFIAGPIILAAGANGYTLWFVIGAVLAILGGVTVMRVKGVN